jgi:putative sterol carrier protein
MSVKYLSDEWFAKIDELAKEVNLEVPAAMAGMKVNMTITSDQGDVKFSMNGGKIQKGHLDDASTKITVPRDLAFKMFVKEDKQAGMQAFMSGKMKIEGDMSKMMAMQSIQPTASQKLLQEKIKEVTVD